MSLEVIIDMSNPNALVAIAYVSENANNPYYAFCEYIKYCMTCHSSPTMMIKEVKSAVQDEFGICLPNSIILRCAELLRTEGFLYVDKATHALIRKQSFDTNAFDERRKSFVDIEKVVIDELIAYALSFGRMWTRDEARSNLIKVLDADGLAFDIFSRTLHPQSTEVVTQDTLELYPNSMFVGKFISKQIESNTEKDDGMHQSEV